MTEHYPCEVTEIDECFLKKISWLITFLVYIPLGQAKIPWGIHQERFWLSVERSLSSLPELLSCSGDSLHPSHPAAETRGHHSAPCHLPQSRSKRQTYLSCSATLLEGSGQIQLEAHGEFSGTAEKPDLSAPEVLTAKGAKCKINQTSRVWKNNVLKTFFLSATL